MLLCQDVSSCFSSYCFWFLFVMMQLDQLDRIFKVLGENVLLMIPPFVILCEQLVTAACGIRSPHTREVANTCKSSTLAVWFATHSRAYIVSYILPLLLFLDFNRLSANCCQCYAVIMLGFTMWFIYLQKTQHMTSCQRCLSMWLLLNTFKYWLQYFLIMHVLRVHLSLTKEILMGFQASILQYAPLQLHLIFGL